MAALLAGTAPSLAQSRHEESFATVTHQIHSTVLGGERRIFVSVPEGSRYGDTLPVLFILDAQDAPQFRAALGVVEFLSAPDRGAIPRFLVIGIPFGETRTHDLTPAPLGALAQQVSTAGGASATLRFITSELLPWIRSRYATAPLNVIVGHSYGGLFAVQAITDRPDVFSIAIAASPSLYWNDGATAREIVRRLASDTSHRRTLFVSSGGRETRLDPAVTAFAESIRAARPANLSFVHQRYPNDTHPLTPLATLVDGLRMAFRSLTIRDDSVLASLAARSVRDSATICAAFDGLVTHYRAAADSLGLRVRFPEGPAYFFGGYAIAVGQPRLAAELLRQNLSRYPGSPSAHNYYGDGLLTSGDTVAALAEYRRAVALATRGDDPGRTAAIASLNELHVATAASQRCRAGDGSRAARSPGSRSPVRCE